MAINGLVLGTFGRKSRNKKKLGRNGRNGRSHSMIPCPVVIVLFCSTRNHGTRLPHLRRDDDLPVFRRRPHDPLPPRLHFQLVVRARPRHFSTFRVSLQVSDLVPIRWKTILC